MNRYDQIFGWVEEHQPEIVLEVGTWEGWTGLQFLKNGAKRYIGFDVFEEATEDLDEVENNVKPHCSLETTRERFNGYEHELIKGNTRATLAQYIKGKKPFVDMAFIDGGHSKATIKSDLLNVIQIMKSDGTIFLDDYYFNCPLPGIGSQEVMRELNLPYKVWPKVEKVGTKDQLFAVKIVSIDMKDVTRPTDWSMPEEHVWRFTP